MRASKEKEKACTECGSVFVPYTRLQHRCKPCSHKRSKGYLMRPDDKNCERCEKLFSPKNENAKFCCLKCQQRASYARNPYNPNTFGTGMTANKGRPQSEEHKRKRRESLEKTLAGTTRNCVKCEESFTPTIASQKYCSGRCWVSVSRKRKDQLHRVTVPKVQYEVLFELQGGRCAICNTPSGSNNRGDKLSVDHCHTSHQIRGLLCHKCNTALGLFKDDEDRLRAALSYLQTARLRPPQ